MNACERHPFPPLNSLTRGVQDSAVREKERTAAISGDASSPGVAGVTGLHGPEDFGPLAAAAVVESDRLRKGIRYDHEIGRGRQGRRNWKG